MTWGLLVEHPFYRPSSHCMGVGAIGVEVVDRFLSAGVNPFRHGHGHRRDIELPEILPLPRPSEEINEFLPIRFCMQATPIGNLYIVGGWGCVSPIKRHGCDGSRSTGGEGTCVILLGDIHFGFAGFRYI